jgi:hypothetical protein
MTNLNLGIDYRTAMVWRIYQAAGLAFLFVPISTIFLYGYATGNEQPSLRTDQLDAQHGGKQSVVTTLIVRRNRAAWKL